MKKYSHIKVGSIVKVLSNSFKVYADEGGNTPPVQTTETPQVNFEALIAKARKEEKEKLYPEITKLKGINEKNIETINGLLVERGALQEEVNNLKKSIVPVKESKEYTDLKAEYETLKSEYETLKKSTPNIEEIRTQVESEYEVKLYAEKKRLEVSSDKSVVGAFLENIKGITKEEVDQSVLDAIEKTKTLKQELGITETPNPTSNTTQEQSQNPAPVISGRPSVNVPGISSLNSRFDINTIRDMDVNSEEYQNLRKSLGLKSKGRL